MDLVVAVVVDQVAECDMAFIVLDLSQHSRGRHLRFDRPWRGRHLGEFADDQCLEAGGREQFLRLRIERGEVERDKDVGLAVFDFQLERRQRVEGRVVDDHASGFQHAEKGDDVMGRVRQKQPDMHAGPTPSFWKPAAARFASASSSA